VVTIKGARQGRTALVTGGTQGVGRATANRLASEGCNLVLIARTARDLEKVRDEIVSATGVSVAVEAIDLSQEQGRNAVAAAHPDIDILICNTGNTPVGGLADIDEARWREGWELKFYGYLALMRAYHQIMCARKSGVLLCVMGVSAERPSPASLEIGMINASLNAMVRALGGTSPDQDVRVVGVNPGPILTERGLAFFRKLAETRLGDAERWQELTADMPFGRFADPDEIATSITFLVSPRASYVSGTVLNIDGGLSTKVLNY
jgi:3-oxoacyl-[acyl-carrier protein] reductase